MSQFLRLLGEPEKASSLAASCKRVRQGKPDANHFEVSQESFNALPGRPFAYWASDSVRRAFESMSPFEGDDRTVKIGMKTGDNFRFLRLSWEATASYRPYAKGGPANSFYGDISTYVKWKSDGIEVKSFVAQRMTEMFGNANYEFWISNESFYGKSGITWSLRAARFRPRLMPTGTIFSVRGYAVFVAPGFELSSLALMNSSVFDYLYKTALGRFGFPEFVGGALQSLPWPILDSENRNLLDQLARRAWLLKRTFETIDEASHAFLLPAALRTRLGSYDPSAIEAELTSIQVAIDEIAFDLYGFSALDRVSATRPLAAEDNGIVEDDAEDDNEIAEALADTQSALLSWAAGVALGRFDWRLATRERTAPPEPDLFDPLPVKSPGMLPDGATPFHTHSGLLVDDPGDRHDLTRLLEEVLVRVDVAVPPDVRRWLQREFFPLHLQRYSKSRRKAPIYWPLSTASGSYTLWVYYSSLTTQTLYSAINDCVEPKLKQVGADVTALRIKGTARSRDDEKQFEVLQAFELELIELRDTLLKLAPTYKPNQDDGVQISAAPLWPLFRHKPWQKILKDTWTKLEKGDYDWAHMAMNYWPDRVREKCKTDKSLAIAHGLEHLYVEPEAKPKKTRGRKKAGDAE